MTNNGGEQKQWAPSQMVRIRSELAEGYRRIKHHIAGENYAGGETVNTMIDGALHALSTAPPTWLRAGTVASLRDELVVPAPATDLTVVGASGFLVFQRPVTLSTLGDAGPAGIAPINALLWWPADFDGHDLHLDEAEPVMIVVHALSTYLTAETSWSPAVWSDSTLTDLGMFPLPLLRDMVPPSETKDDLAPAIELLLGLGAAAREQRVLFESVAVSGGGETGQPRPRAVSVLVDA
ncbi:MAG: hypothetical protein WBA38_08555 [Gordonia sp. (in: high G+C Gram-positive bacteria)]|uniref:hypothetical protein n=2 Tax=Gordonia sp. (in: high G+C Gram-positive bacteria) TaxID=84139 RepID=UPI003C735A32